MTICQHISYRAATVIILSILFSGCASQVNMLPLLDENATISPEQGILVARVINASGGRLPFNQLTVVPENYNESRNIKPDRLIAMPADITGTTVFASPIKAGRYTLSSLRAYYSNGEYWYSDIVPADSSLGTFEVSTGKTTDLGILIYYPKSEGDRYRKTLIRRPNSANGAIISQYFPQFHTYSEQLLTWEEDGGEAERFESYLFAAQNPVAFAESGQGPDGSLYFPGKLGLIIKRLPNGEWRQDAVDTDFDLTTIAISSENQIVVGGDEGKVFAKQSDSDDEWRDISLNPGQHIEKLIFHTNHQVDAVIRQDTYAIIYRMDLNTESLEWQKMNTFNNTKGWENSSIKNPSRQTSLEQVIAGISIINLNGKHYISLRSYNKGLGYSPVFSHRSTKTFEYDPATWRVDKPEKSLKISSLLDAGAIKLGIEMPGFWSWDGQPDYYRYIPEKNTWSSVETSISLCKNFTNKVNGLCKAKKKPYAHPGYDPAREGEKYRFSFSTIPWFKTDNDVIAIGTIRYREGREWKHKRKMLESNDGGKSWKISDGDMPQEYCIDIIPKLKDRLLISCNGSSSDFYESTDGGKSWIHVRQHGNF